MFIIKKKFYNVVHNYTSSRIISFFITEIIVERVNLIQIQNKIGKYYIHDEEQLGFHQKTKY